MHLHYEHYIWAGLEPEICGLRLDGLNYNRCSKRFEPTVNDMILNPQTVSAFFSNLVHCIYISSSLLPLSMILVFSKS